MALKKLMDVVLKQSKHMAVLVARMVNNFNGGGKSKPGMQLAKDEKCQMCKHKKLLGGLAGC